MKHKPTLGILGVGKLGTALARLALDSGYPVLIASSKPVEAISLTVDVLVPGAQAMLNTDVVKQADIILLALPLSKLDTIPTDGLKNKVVIDAMNYWWEVDGPDRIPSDPNQTSSEMVAAHLESQNVVKAFNHMGYHDIEYEAHQPQRKVIAIASDDENAKVITQQLIVDLGFDCLDLGPLSHGRVLEPGSKLFGANLERNKFTDILKTLLHE